MIIVSEIEVIVDDANMKHLPGIKTRISEAQSENGNWKCWGCGETFPCTTKPKQVVKTTEREGQFCQGCCE